MVCNNVVDTRTNFSDFLVYHPYVKIAIKRVIKGLNSLLVKRKKLYISVEVVCFTETYEI